MRKRYSQAERSTGFPWLVFSMIRRWSETRPKKSTSASMTRSRQMKSQPPFFDRLLLLDALDSSLDVRRGHRAKAGMPGSAKKATAGCSRRSP
jgi:hypothetical protein